MEWESLKSKNEFKLQMGMFSIGSVEVYDAENQNLLLFAKSRVFKWKGLKIFSDKQMQNEMLSIIQDFDKQKQGKTFKEKIKALYVVTDTRQAQKLAQVQYSFRNLFGTNYDLLDLNDQPLGEVTQIGNAFIAAMLAFVQPTFEIKLQGHVVAILRGHFSLFKKKFTLEISDSSADIRIIMAAAVLVLGMDKVKSR